MSGRRSPSPAEDDLISPGQSSGKSGGSLEKRKGSDKEPKDSGKSSKKIKREGESHRDSSSGLDLFSGEGSGPSESALGNAPP